MVWGWTYLPPLSIPASPRRRRWWSRPSSSASPPGRFKGASSLVQMLLSFLVAGSGRARGFPLLLRALLLFAHSPGPLAQGCKERNDGPLVFCCVCTLTRNTPRTPLALHPLRLPRGRRDRRSTGSRVTVLPRTLLRSRNAPLWRRWRR